MFPALAAILLRWQRYFEVDRVDIAGYHWQRTRWRVLQVRSRYAIYLLTALILALSTLLQAQTFKVIHVFQDYPDGATPWAGLTLDKNGNLYGTTVGGGTEYEAGTVYEISKFGAETVLYTFSDGQTAPEGPLITDHAGNLYGAATNIVRLSTSGQETILFTFTNNSEGDDPLGNLVRDPAGNLYGTTKFGGEVQCDLVGGCGVVYKVTPSGEEIILHAFSGGTDGAGPTAGLIRNTAGNLYGTTSVGGTGEACYAGCGTVFVVDTADKETVLYDFTGGPDGSVPSAGLIADAADNVYGTTTFGGQFGDGVVFKISKTGLETTLHSFSGSPLDGENPYAALVRDVSGNLYGTTFGGGKYQYGTVFRLAKDGTETVLHNFTGGRDGAFPLGGLLLDSKGNLYGTASQGGRLGQCLGNGYSNGCGIVFQITP
jgi:uncharacterized repeat protein (TIGR03803 family)